MFSTCSSSCSSDLLALAITFTKFERFLVTFINQSTSRQVCLFYASASCSVAIGIIFLSCSSVCASLNTTSWEVLDRLSPNLQHWCILDKDKCFKFFGRKVKGQGHCGIKYAGNSPFSLVSRSEFLVFADVVITAALDDVVSPTTYVAYWSYHHRQVILSFYVLCHLYTRLAGLWHVYCSNWCICVSNALFSIPELRDVIHWS